MHIDIVVSRFNEDISWLSEFCQVNLETINRVFVYNKGQTDTLELPNVHGVDIVHEHLPNIGREADTYLHHIITNYDVGLNEYTLFLQGWPHDHLKGIALNTIDLRSFSGASFENLIRNHNIKKEIYVPDHTISPYGLPVWLKTVQYFGIQENPLVIHLSRGAQFICSRERIKTHPKTFYRRIRSELCALRDTNPRNWTGLYTDDGNDPNVCIDAWTLERIWPFIFGQT